MANITLGTLRDYWKRVYDAITGPPGSTAPTYAMQVGGTDGANLRALKTDASGNLSVLLNGRRAALASANYNQALNVPASGGTTITITPPPGELWRLKNLYVSIPIPAGGTTGTHRVQIMEGTNSCELEVIDATCAYNQAWTLRTNGLLGTYAVKRPAAEGDQQRAILNTVVTNAYPLVIYYTNNTDVAQTGTAVIRVTREVEYIVA